MKRYRKEDQISYALGMTLLFELFACREKLVRKVYLHSKLNRNEAYIELMERCGKLGVDVQINDKAFHILSQKENCFVIGEFEKYKDELRAQDPHVVLVNPSNAGNLGTIIRSCRGFGVKDIAIIKPAADHFDPKVVRASMGAVFGVRIETFESFQEYADRFGNHNFYPFLLHASSSLQDTAFLEPFSLIFGNEAAGLPEQFNEIGHSVIIRHNQEIDSLNLPIAASIALYEATKNTIRLE